MNSNSSTPIRFIRERVVSVTVFVVLIFLINASGCSEARPFDSVIVYGQVTVDSEPIANGEIRFVPQSGTTGPVSGGPIINGGYRVATKGGVPVGTHLVRIQSFGGSGRLDQSMPDEVQDDFASDAEQRLPSRFNTASELTAKIEQGNSQQEVDFHLTTK